MRHDIAKYLILAISSLLVNFGAVEGIVINPFYMNWGTLTRPCAASNGKYECCSWDTCVEKRSRDVLSPFQGD